MNVARSAAAIAARIVLIVSAMTWNVLAVKIVSAPIANVAKTANAIEKTASAVNKAQIYRLFKGGQFLGLSLSN